MNIHAVGGDIVELAPQLAQAAVLWLRKGFNRRYVTWDTQMLPRYRSCLYDIIPDSVETPWLWPHDRFSSFVRRMADLIRFTSFLILLMPWELRASTRLKP